MTTHRPLLAVLAFGCATFVLVAAPARAQEAGQQSTTSGTVVTGSDVAGGAFSPGAGTVAAEASPAVATATALAGTALVTSLTNGTLTGTTATGASVAIPTAVQAAVLSILTGTSNSATVNTLATTLATSGVPGSATALAQSLQNLISSPSTGQLAQAVGHFNTLVNGADANFLSSPPAEFLAVSAVLAQLVSAAQSAQSAS